MSFMFQTLPHQITGMSIIGAAVITLAASNAGVELRMPLRPYRNLLHDLPGLFWCKVSILTFSKTLAALIAFLSRKSPRKYPVFTFDKNFPFHAGSI
jgi:hypothetical protein